MKMFPSTCRISVGLLAFVIQFYLLTVATGSDPESKYCGSALTHARCSRQENGDRGWSKACEDYMTNDKISPGDLFDTLLDRSNCSDEFTLGKTGFSLTMLNKYREVYATGDEDILIHCAADFDPLWTWINCSGFDSICDASVEVCDADKPGDNCFTTNSTHWNGCTQEYFGTFGTRYEYKIFSMFLDGQVPCTRCLLQLRTKNGGLPHFCVPIAIKREESASKDTADAEKKTNSGNYNTQIGHITIFFSTMITFIIVSF